MCYVRLIVKYFFNNVLNYIKDNFAYYLKKNKKVKQYLD